MADKIVIAVRPFNGSYEFEVEEQVFTSLEWRWIKKISGYLPMTLNDGWAGRDPDLFVAFAVIAMARAGKIGRDEALIVADLLAEAPFDGVSIQFVGDEAEADASPPDEPSATTSSTENGGKTGSTSSDPSGSRPRLIGAPDSEKSYTSDRATSLT